MSAKASLKVRVLRSGGWSVGGNMFGQLIRLASNLIMTRLLFPSDFGLMAVVQVLMVGLTLLSDLGTSQSLIYHRRGEEAAFRQTAWTLQVVRGGGIWLTSIVAAGIIALGAHQNWFASDSTYSDPRLPLVIVVCSFQMVIQGFMSSRSALAQRSLQLKQLTLIQIYGQLGSLAAMMIWGYLFGDIWTLVVGALVAMLIQVVLSHTYLTGPGDHFAWDKSSLQELLAFGRWVFLSSTIGFLASGGDRLMLGALENAQTVGIYAIAYLLLTPIQTILLMVVGVIIFPALSEINRERPESLGATYARFQRLVDVGVFFSAGLLVVAAPAIVSVMYDHRYESAGWMLSTLALSLVGNRFLVLEQVFKAKGQSSLSTLANFMRFVALFTLVPVAHHFGGLSAAIWAISASTLGAWPLTLWYRHRHGFPALKADGWAIPSMLAGLSAGWMLSWLIDALTSVTSGAGN